MSDNSWVVETIIALRGPAPANCDFCGQPYAENRYPTPEEAGQWACIECVERWEKEDAEMATPDRENERDT